MSSFRTFLRRVKPFYLFTCKRAASVDYSRVDVYNLRLPNPSRKTLAIRREQVPLAMGSITNDFAELYAAADQSKFSYVALEQEKNCISIGRTDRETLEELTRVTNTVESEECFELVYSPPSIGAARYLSDALDKPTASAKMIAFDKDGDIKFERYTDDVIGNIYDDYLREQLTKKVPTNITVAGKKFSTQLNIGGAHNKFYGCRVDFCMHRLERSCVKAVLIPYLEFVNTKTEYGAEHQLNLIGSKSQHLNEHPRLPELIAGLLHVSSELICVALTHGYNISESSIFGVIPIYSTGKCVVIKLDLDLDSRVSHLLKTKKMFPISNAINNLINNFLLVA